MTHQRLELRPLTSADVPFGMRLAELAGWNQTPADWRRAVQLASEGAWAARIMGRDAGTITTCRFGAVGWIGVLLVDPELRRRGVGRKLFERALEWLESHGVQSIRLDATPLGQPLYDQYGFQVDFELSRYAGAAYESVDDAERRLHTSSPIVEVVDAEETQIAQIASLDQRFSNVNRTALIRAWLQARDSKCLVLPHREEETSSCAAGYVACRAGRMAVQIGPCVADAPDAATLLLDAALHRCRGQSVFVDVPNVNRAAIARVCAAGLAPVRTLVRMTRGPRASENLAGYWASGGPEKG